VKLLNRTRVPAAALEAVLVAAGRMVGARTSGVVVCVSHGNGGGMAYECVRVRWAGRRWMNTDGGAFRIRLGCGDPLDVAVAFFKTAAHEWCHIREYQLGGRSRFAFSGWSGLRRPNHDDRPEELRVYKRLREKEEKGRDVNAYAEEVIGLALALGARP